MKKIYKVPVIIVSKIQCSHMLCESQFDIYNYTVSEEENYYDDFEGYDDAW
ncbi:MAG: hypothetical protein Q4A08_06815 [Bacteroidales bacterium]|nr:hypothetical protein [Bacteroidales bacterium]